MNIGHTHMMAAAGAGGGIIDLPNLELFWDTDTSYTDDGSTLCSTDGDLIYRVDDLTGGGVNALQTVETNRPTFKTNIVNGKAVTRTNGTDNLMCAGDNLDSVFAGADKKFAFIMSITGYSVSAPRVALIRKLTNNQLSFTLDLVTGQPFFFWGTPTQTAYRAARATSSIGTGPLVLSVEYDGSIDTGDGLDRVVIAVNGTPISTFLVYGGVGALPDISDTTSQICFGGMVYSPSDLYYDAFDFSKQVILSDPTTESVATCVNEMMTDWGL